MVTRWSFIVILWSLIVILWSFIVILTHIILGLRAARRDKSRLYGLPASVFPLLHLAAQQSLSIYIAGEEVSDLYGADAGGGTREDEVSGG